MKNVYTIMIIIKPIVRREIKLSIVICHHIFGLYIWLDYRPLKVWLTYIGVMGTQVKFNAIWAKILC